MIPYEIIVTAVSDRSDLFVETMESMISHLDILPSRILVHENIREGSSPGTIVKWLEEYKNKTGIDFAHKVTPQPNSMAIAVLWLLKEAKTPIVLHSQEDWQYLRTIPLERALEVMTIHNLNHITFNKRKTMRFKNADTPNPWEKIEVEFSVPSSNDTQKLCVCDHWRTQTGLWRVQTVLPAVEITKDRADANHFVAGFNDWLNKTYGAGKVWNDQQMRHEKIKTYIWGPVAEPAFIKHLGSFRTTTNVIRKKPNAT